MYKSITTAVALLALAGAGAAFAQTAAGTSTQPASKAAMHGMHHRHAHYMQAQLAKLKTRLKITSKQEPAWNGFVQAVQNMRPGMNSKTKRQASSPTVPEIFAGMAQRAQQRAEKARTLAKAADQLYDRLSSAQKASWNEAMAEMHAKMHHRWHKHPGMNHAPNGSTGGQG